jgi:hypothetical protein
MKFGAILALKKQIGKKTRFAHSDGQLSLFNKSFSVVVVQKLNFLNNPIINFYVDYF